MDRRALQIGSHGQRHWIARVLKWQRSCRCSLRARIIRCRSLLRRGRARCVCVRTGWLEQLATLV